MATTAKPFTNGGSQAVRLPREFRFRGTEVRIYREANRGYLEPLEPDAVGAASSLGRIHTGRLRGPVSFGRQIPTLTPSMHATPVGFS